MIEWLFVAQALVSFMFLRSNHHLGQRLKLIEAVLDKIVLQKVGIEMPPIEVKPLITRKARTEEQRRAASEKRKEWWAKKRAADIKPAPLPE